MLWQLELIRPCLSVSFPPFLFPTFPTSALLIINCAGREVEGRRRGLTSSCSIGIPPSRRGGELVGRWVQMLLDQEIISNQMLLLPPEEKLSAWQSAPPCAAAGWRAAFFSILLSLFDSSLPFFFHSPTLFSQIKTHFFFFILTCFLHRAPSFI